MSDSEEVVSAATSCLLYVHQHNESAGAGHHSSNTLIQDWVNSAERRTLCSRFALKFLRNTLKKARKNRVSDLTGILQLLIEGKGVIPDIADSALARMQDLREALTRRGWWVKFGDQNDWERIELHKQPVCFGLLSDVERCFDFRGQQIEPLTLYHTGECREFAELALNYGFHNQVGLPEMVDNTLVWRCFIHAGVNHDDRKTDRAA